MIVLVLGVPFVIGLCAMLTALLDPFGRDAQTLIATLANGEFSRVDDVIGYLVILLLVYGLSAVMIFGMVRDAAFTPDQHVTINPGTRTIRIDWRYPLLKDVSATYGFDEVDHIELKRGYETFSDQEEVWLHVQDRRQPIVLVNIIVTPHVFAEYDRLLGLGLPRRPDRT